MTQGWRNYSYLDELDMLDSFKAPEIQDYISGYLEKLKFGSDPVPAEGEVLIYFAGNSERIATDANGTFSFLPEFTGHHSAPIMLTGYGIKGKEKIILRLDEAPASG